MTVFAAFLYFHRSKQQIDNGDDDDEGSQYDPVTPWSDPQLVALQLDADGIEDVKRLGVGLYEELWLVRYQGDRLLVSMRFPAYDITRERTQGFAGDIKFMARLVHPNIVALVGVAWTPDGGLQVLSEYVDSGDLREYLRNSTDHGWSATKLRIAIGVIDALAYAHSFLPPIVYGGLKSHNVLLTSDLVPKLTDFAASRKHSGTFSVMAAMPTCRWTAPEMLSYTQECDQRSDIFGLGWLLAELDSYRYPFEGEVNAHGEPLGDVEVWRLILAGDLRLSISPTCPRNVRALIERCLALDPTLRPSAAECAYELHVTLQSLSA